jgi:hypothetical protein
VQKHVFFICAMEWLFGDFSLFENTTFGIIQGYFCPVVASFFWLGRARLSPKKFSAGY